MRWRKRTVTAGAVYLANVVDLVILNGNLAAAIMLYDFVLRMLCASANDESITFTGEGNSILADIAEPDVANCAGALAVYALEGSISNNHILERCFILKNKHSIFRAGVFVSAVHAAVEFLVVEVLGLAGWNNARFR